MPFRRDAEELTTSGIGISAWLGGEYQYPLGDSGTGSGASQWRLRAGGDVRRKEYRASEFDRMTLSGHVGPRWLIGRGSEASLLLSALHEWTGSGLEDPSHHDIGFRVEGRHRLTPRTTLNARASWHRRTYDEQDHRDGPIVDFSLGTGWVASPTLRFNAAMGWGSERTELERWRNSRRWVQLGATVVLPWGFIVDEGSLASTVQARDLLRIADALRIPRVVLVGDEKQLDAVDAGKPFAQLQGAGMKTAVMDQIMRQRDPALKEAVEASLAGDISRAFEKLGDNVAEVNPDNLAGAAAARWLALSPEQRENTGLMAPSHALREGINGIVRERLTRDGVVHGPAMEGERLVSRGYTNAEKALARNYMAGDVVGFHRPYKRLGVEKGDELRVAGVDRTAGTVTLAGKDGGTVAWQPGRIAARAGGVEVYRKETMELRAGDCIRWTRNDAGLGLVNSQTAEVTAVRDGRVGFRLEDGRMLDMNAGDPQLRHIDRAWASTVHAFQGRTVDTVIAAIEANHPNLTNRKMLYVEISRARDRVELVTDDKAALKEQLQALTGERIAALEALGEAKAKTPEAAKAGGLDAEIGGERSAGRTAEPEKTPAPKSIDRDLGL